MNVAAIYEKCKKKKTAITTLQPSKNDLTTGTARRNYPTGAVFMYKTTSFDDALEIMRRYAA